MYSCPVSASTFARWNTGVGVNRHRSPDPIKDHVQRRCCALKESKYLFLSRHCDGASLPCLPYPCAETAHGSRGRLAWRPILRDFCVKFIKRTKNTQISLSLIKTLPQTYQGKHEHHTEITVSDSQMVSRKALTRLDHQIIQPSPFIGHKSNQLRLHSRVPKI